MRRRPSARPPVLGEDVVLLLLTGRAPRVSAVRRLLFTSDGNLARVAALWREHEALLLREAAKRRLQRPHDSDLGRPAYFGEYAVAMVAKCPERYGV